MEKKINGILMALRWCQCVKINVHVYYVSQNTVFEAIFENSKPKSREYLMRNFDIFHNQEINKNILFS